MANISTAITSIDFCTGVHGAAGLTMVETREIRTEPLAEYTECPEDEQIAVRDALHAYMVARAEAESRINCGWMAPRVIDDHDSAWEDRLFTAGREDSETFCEVYAQATTDLKALIVATDPE